MSLKNNRPSDSFPILVIIMIVAAILFAIFRGLHVSW